MSGFVGVIPTGSTTNEQGLVARMSQQLIHRGALEDVTEGDGPVFAIRNLENGAYQASTCINAETAVVFDGILWNLADLVKPSAPGNSAQAICRGFAEEGTDFFSRLDGSFAAVVHDRGSGVTHLVRDRFGCRPLSYAIIQDRLLVGSEIKAFLVDPSLPRTVNREAISALFDLGFLPGPDTLLQRVFKALPGETTTIEGGSVRSTPLDYEVAPVENDRSVTDLADLVDELLERTVVEYGNSETRFGVLLSGGIDSGLVAEKLPDRSGPIQAVSFGAQGWEGDEMTAAQDRAAQLGIPFVGTRVDENFDPYRHLESAIWHIEEPTRFETCVSLEVMFSSVAGSVDAIATGEGADLLFGSATHVFARWLPKVWRLPRRLRQKSARWLRSGTSTWRTRAGRYLDTNSLPEHALRSIAWAPPAETGPDQPGFHDRIAGLEKLFASLPAHSRVTIVEVLTLTAPWIERMEQTGAAYGIDVVHPYERDKMLEHALTSPYRLKVSRWPRGKKPALARLADRNLGSRSARPPKRQFGAPYQQWLNDSSSSFRQAALDLRNPDARHREFTDAGWIEPFLDDFAVNGSADRKTSRVVFILLGLEIWLRRFTPREPPHAP